MLQLSASIMRFAEKSPLWQWDEIVRWLFKHKIIENQQILDDALFFANINAALGELDKNTKKCDIICWNEWKGSHIKNLFQVLEFSC